MTVEDGQITVTEGDWGLDWQCRDWERVTCIHSSRQVLRDVLTGRRILSEALFDRELGFAPAARHPPRYRPDGRGLDHPLAVRAPAARAHAGTAGRGGTLAEPAWAPNSPGQAAPGVKPGA